MFRFGMLATVLLVVSAGNLGCYYDQWIQAKRANGVLQEDLARAKADLQDCEQMREQLNQRIDGLNNEMAAKNAMITKLEGEVAHLRDAFDGAQKALEEAMAKGPGETVVISQQLPPQLREKLRELAAAHPDLIEYDDAKGAVRWKADLLFPLGSDDLPGAGEVLEALKEFASIVNSSAAAGFDVIVVGHTCTTPIRKPETLAEHKTNWHLSAHRAISVMRLLAENGVSMERMGVMGYGEYRPIASNATTEGKAKNRRVEIYLVDRDQVKSMSLGIRAVEGMDLAYLPAVQR